MTASAPAGGAAGRTARILCISGPNLQLLGTREPEVYGRTTLAEIHARLERRASALGVEIEARQTNHEGTIVDWIGESRATGVHGLILNPGAYTHTSIALFDALSAVALPCIEVHLSNPDAREPFRRRSRIAKACVGRVAGFGADSYELALEGLVRFLARGRSHA
ncbi:MAG TPA: type II 3-dehydroquinate dehydratase [Polyangiaceae bacterium]|jgi:3-dehydroquinate dehydratase II|nr:type II 3-dehydroquinate dehydratase [Polyangiaceae bacterium]